MLNTAVEAKESPPQHVVEFPVPTTGKEVRLEMHKVGICCFLLSEVAFFSTLLTAYVVFLHGTGSPPTPKDTLSLPLVSANTLCLLASSSTVHRAERRLRKGMLGGFILWWTLTILLGLIFLAGTAIEWHGLIDDHGLTIGRNMFGTTYYTLVGFHAFHVTLGVIALIFIGVLTAKFQVKGAVPLPVSLVSWYWHFVDAVWIVVFSVVYVFGR